MSQYYDGFISYGRADSKAFATRLYQDLTQAGLKIWFDGNDIPLAVDFQNRIDDGIEKSHNFLFIISPHSVNSPYCLKEIELAVKYKKRIIPLLHVEEITYEIWQERNSNKTETDWEEYRAKGLHSSFPNMHPEIGRINWVYFRENVDDSDKSLGNLIELFSHGKDSVQKHTQILVKALDWERNKKLTRYLLIGKERLEAEQWLKNEFNNKQQPCFPTDLQCEFICESIKSANNLMTKVFLSYSDGNREIMEKIRNYLMRHGITVWTNQTDIKTGIEFQQAIDRGIEGADNFVFLLSPESLESEYCRLELARACSQEKRIISLLIEPIRPEKIPPELQIVQFINLTVTEKEKYQKGLDSLIKELAENAIYYQEHKFLLVKALKWKEQKQNPSLLLRGYNLDRYQTWLEIAGKKQLHPPTDLQREFIAESAKQPPDLALDVFVSYSRVDSDFARRLNDALQTQGKTTWFDQESIATGTDFQAEIYRGIEQSDNFLFVISPDSVNSPYCADEVEYARSLNKRFVTVLHRGVNYEQLHPELAKVQWLDFNLHGGDFYGNFSELVRTLDTDRDHVREHTKKCQMALEWKRGNKSIDLLLRGSEYARGYEWLREVQAQKKQPAVSEEIEEFILESKAEVERLQTAERRRKNTIAAVAVGTIVFLSGLSIFAWQQKSEAERQSAIAFARQLAAESQVTLTGGGLQERGTLLAVESMKKFQSLNQPSVGADVALRNALNLLPVFVSRGNHDGPVTDAAFSADGKYLATASSDKTARVWEAATGEEIARVSHDRDAKVVAFSPDGKYLATGGWDNTTRVWETATGKEIARLSHDSPVNTLAFSADGKYLATAAMTDKTVRVWEAIARTEITTLSHDGEVWGLTFSADSKYLVTVSADKTARRWDAATGKEVARFKHDGDLRTVAFSADGNYVATIGSDYTVRVYDAIAGKETTKLNRDEEVIAIALSPDGKYLATGSWENAARVWEAATGKEVAKLDRYGAVNAIVFSPDGKYVATASYDKTARVWEAATGKEVAKVNRDRLVTDVAFSADGKYLAIASYDKTATVWQLTIGSEVAKLNHDREVEVVAFSADGNYLTTVTKDNTATVWQPAEGKEVAKLDSDRRVTVLAFSADGNYLATGSRDKTVRVRSASTGEKVAEIKQNQSIKALAFSADGKYLATASSDRLVRVWSVSTGQEIIQLNHPSPLDTLAFSADGKYIATGSRDKTARVWNASTGEEIAKLDSDASVKTVKFGPDGKYLVTASSDYSASVWNLSAGEKVARLKHENSLKDIAFSPDGKYVATASDDNTARVWETDTGRQVAKLSHDWYVNAVAFSPDGKYLATASSDYSAWLWEVSASRQVAQLKHDREVLGVAFSPDGKYLATASWDKTARVHFLNPQDLINEACRRLGRNLTANEWERYMNLDLDRYGKTCDNLPIHPSLAAIGRELAKEGEVKEAIALFRRILELEPAIDLNPETEEIDNDPEAVARGLVGGN